MMDELVKDARVNKKTIYGTFFDLEDAFGSGPHELIYMTLKRNFLPDHIITYFTNVYSNLQAVVSTKCWKSQSFQFRRGGVSRRPHQPHNIPHGM